MFIIDVEYTANLEQINAVLAEHRAWLDTYYQQGVFLFSGPRNPRTGGVIIARGSTKSELEHLMQQDPFAVHGVAKHHISEFQAIKTHPELKQFIEN